MVDINESTLTSEKFAAKENDPTANLIEDDLMDNLAYSDSDATSVTMNDEEFADAIDHLPSDANEDGKLNRSMISTKIRKKKLLIVVSLLFFVLKTIYSIVSNR